MAKGGVEGCRPQNIWLAGKFAVYQQYEDCLLYRQRWLEGSLFCLQIGLSNPPRIPLSLSPACNCFVQGSCTILISKFREFSRTIQGQKQTVSRSFNYQSETCRMPKIPKTRHFLAFHEFCMYGSSLNYFLDIFLLIFSIFCVVNEVNSNYLQISRSLINFQGKIVIFKEFQVPLKKAIQIQALVKESRTCTSPVCYISFQLPFVHSCIDLFIQFLHAFVDLPIQHFNYA